MTETKPKFTIITAALNCEIYIQNCLESIYKQTYSNWDHLIIDGGSSDKTIEIVRSYSRSRLIKQKTSGLWPAMQEALEFAEGYIQFLNSDDYFFDKYVLESVADSINASEKPKNIIFYGKSLRVNFANAPIYMHTPPSKLSLWKFNIYFPLISHQEAFIHSDIYSKVSLINKRYAWCHDIAFFRSLFILGYKFQPLRRTVACFRLHNSNASDKQFRSYAKYLFSDWNNLSISFFPLIKLLTVLCNPAYLVYLIKRRFFL